MGVWIVLEETIQTKEKAKRFLYFSPRRLRLRQGFYLFVFIQKLITVITCMCWCLCRKTAEVYIFYLILLSEDLKELRGWPRGCSI